MSPKTSLVKSAIFTGTLKNGLVKSFFQDTHRTTKSTAHGTRPPLDSLTGLSPRLHERNLKHRWILVTTKIPVSPISKGGGNFWGNSPKHTVSFGH